MNQLFISPAITGLVDAASLVPNEIGESKSCVYGLRLRDGRAAYLKVSAAPYVVAEMRAEVSVLRWLDGKLAVPRPLQFEESEGRGFFLMTALPGVDLSRAGMPMADSLRLGAAYLRKIHSLPIAGCPYLRDRKTTLALADENIRAGLVDESDFDGERAGWTTAEVWAELERNLPETEDLVFTHGDFCFPNIICERGAISGVVDLGRAGVADRYQDIAIFLRSFASNTGAPVDPAEFLRHYGLIADIDEKKRKFYQILDEFF